MKKDKIIEMVCPSCKVHFGSEPIIMIEKDGNTHMEHHLPKKCQYCRTGLIRNVIEVKE
jgi:hypothetical protein